MRSIALFVFLAGITSQHLAAAQAVDPPTSSGGTVYAVESDTPTTTYEGLPPVSARGDTAAFLAYDFGIPLGSVRDFAANVSPVGVELQFRGWVMDRFSLGLGAEWSRYLDERSRSTFNVENAAITASAYNHLQMTNARLLLHYYLTQGNVRPYLGPNVGLGWTWFETEAADIALSNTQFSMNFGGEVGVLFGERPTVLANLRYTWIPAAEFLGVVDDVQTLSAQVGVGL